ncbi:hypothetical protein Leryth_010659 [Lithospermum erythrorhizon]|nr:hypothetical protein Leryth_010659 [Lithospermum erythrorhizon]
MVIHGVSGVMSAQAHLVGPNVGACSLDGARLNGKMCLINLVGPSLLWLQENNLALRIQCVNELE